MAELKVFARGPVPTAPTACYQNPDSAAAATLRQLVLCNTTPHTRHFSLWLVPAGQPATRDFQLYADFPVPPKQTIGDAYSSLLLDPGDSLHWRADRDGLVAHLCGLTDLPTARFAEVAGL